MRLLCISFFIFFALNITSGTAHAEANKIYPSWWTQIFAFDDHNKQRQIETLARKINDSLMPDKNIPLYERVRLIRKFIHDNSVNIIDNEFYNNWGNLPALLQMLDDHARNPQSERPHLECATQSVVMYILLREAGIVSRIMIVHPDVSGITSHTFVEVYDHELQKWTIQDPLLNIFWKFKNTNERASTEDLMRYPIKKAFIPCTSPTSCGYTKAAEDIVSYFSMAEIVDLGAMYHPIMVNPDRFSTQNLTEYFDKVRFYCDILFNGCSRNVIEIESKPEPDLIIR